jgi:hypothetical protein
MIFFRFAHISAYNKREVFMKTISKRQYDFLAETLAEQVAQQVMTDAAKEAVLSAYEVRDSLNFVRIIGSIGGILIGLGFFNLHCDQLELV